MHLKSAYAVLLAGGSGTRLWPLSRVDFPKQLLPLEGQQTLLEKSVARIAPLFSVAQRYIVTTQQWEPLVRSRMSGLVGELIVEPQACNTAPAILYSCLQIFEQDPDALLVYLPSDHAIKNESLFRATLLKAITYAQRHDAIVLLGVAPTYAATSYGYIAYDALSAADELYSVRRFHEKPAPEVAQQYYQQDGMLWNTGIVCVRARVLMQEFQKYAPAMLTACSDYAAMPVASFDYAILEKSDRVVVVRSEFGWSDLGTLETFIAASAAYAPVQQINLKGAHTNLIHAKKQVVVVGLTHLCVIETDDCIVVMPRTELDNVVEIAKMASSKAL